MLSVPSKGAEGMSAEILSEGLRLSELGLAVHWLRPRTKIPVAGAYQRLPWLPPHVLRGMKEPRE